MPGGGWANEEDDPVAFILAPPGVPLAEARQATNVILVMPGVQAASMNCAGAPSSSAPTSPRGLAEWFTRHPQLAASHPKRVTIGGLHGYQLSVKLSRLGGLHCGSAARVMPLLDNLAEPQAQFGIGGPTDHTLVYLLNTSGVTLGIIADSTSPQSPSLATDASVIRHFHFTS